MEHSNGHTEAQSTVLRGHGDGHTLRTHQRPGRGTSQRSTHTRYFPPGRSHTRGNARTESALKQGFLLFSPSATGGLNFSWRFSSPVKISWERPLPRSQVVQIWSCKCCTPAGCAPTVPPLLPGQQRCPCVLAASLKKLLPACCRGRPGAFHLAAARILPGAGRDERGELKGGRGQVGLTTPCLAWRALTGAKKPEQEPHSSAILCVLKEQFLQI